MADHAGVILSLIVASGMAMVFAVLFPTRRIKRRCRFRSDPVVTLFAVAAVVSQPHAFTAEALRYFNLVGKPVEVAMPLVHVPDLHKFLRDFGISVPISHSQTEPQYMLDFKFIRGLPHPDMSPELMVEWLRPMIGHEFNIPTNKWDSVFNARIMQSLLNQLHKMRPHMNIKKILEDVIQDYEYRARNNNDSLEPLDPVSRFELIASTPGPTMDIGYNGDNLFFILHFTHTTIALDVPSWTIERVWTNSSLGNRQSYPFKTMRALDKTTRTIMIFSHGESRVIAEESQAVRALFIEGGLIQVSALGLIGENDKPLFETNGDHVNDVISIKAGKPQR